jgi:hypothetical protein
MGKKGHYLKVSPRKKYRYIRVCRANPGAGRVMGYGRKILDLWAFKGQYLTSKSGRFRQMGFK